MAADLRFRSVTVRDCVLDSMSTLAETTDLNDFCAYFQISMYICFGIMAEHPEVLFQALRWSLDPGAVSMIFSDEIRDTLQVLMLVFVSIQQ